VSAYTITCLHIRSRVCIYDHVSAYTITCLHIRTRVCVYDQSVCRVPFRGSHLDSEDHLIFLLHGNVQWFRGRLVFKAHRLCVSLNSRLESNKEEKKRSPGGARCCGTALGTNKPAEARLWPRREPVSVPKPLKPLKLSPPRSVRSHEERRCSNLGPTQSHI